ncbi:MAG: Fic family protein [Kiritimatiellae bacterium]|nr:Fic family protein [Kiritimatiellia bacterium]
MKPDDLLEYTRAGEPHLRQRAENWRVAIGLQKVDGLETSEYLIDAARRNIEGEISLTEVRKLLDGYYKARPTGPNDEQRVEEADKVSQRIAEILAEPAFSFAPSELISIHRRLFDGIFKHAGQLRDYNITKSEWVLRGDTVFYATADALLDTLAYDFGQERDFSYVRLSREESVRHFARFISRLWQIHPFGEGNTRTTAVFTVKYLRMLGFNVSNEPFVENSWYFRNALVRANYTNLTTGVEETLLYLERFFDNLLFGANHSLRNREMLVGGGLEVKNHAANMKGDPASNPASNPASKAPALSEQVTRLMLVLDGEMSRRTLMSRLSIKDRNTFASLYLEPALRIGYIELTQPDSPRSPTQKYRLTEKGRKVAVSIAGRADS